MATVTGEHNIKRAVQAMEGRRRIDRERGQQFEAKHERETVVDKNGRLKKVLVHQIDQIKKTGIRPVGRNGVSGSLFFGMSGATGDYHRGPDGMYFIWDDGWCPTTLWYKGTAPQHDPDGNLWVLKDGEWVLESEVGSGD